MIKNAFHRFFVKNKEKRLQVFENKKKTIDETQKKKQKKRNNQIRTYINKERKR